MTSRADLDATAQLTVDLIDQAVALLQTQNADPIGDSFVAIVHPHTSYDIRKDPNWIEAHKYAAPEEIFNGEIGKINNVRFVVSSEAKVWKGDGCRRGWLCTARWYWVPTPTRPPNWKAAACSTL